MPRLGALALATTLTLGTGVVVWAAERPASQSARTTAVSTQAMTAGTSAAVVAALGAVPIATPPPESDRPSVARPGHPAVVAMGAPVHATLPAGAGAPATSVNLTVLGPRQQFTGALVPGAKLPSSTMGSIDVVLNAGPGRLTIAAADLSSKDETGKVVRLAAVGPTRISLSGTAVRRLRLQGRFPNGSAQVTWQHDGHVLAVWVFTIELD